MVYITGDCCGDFKKFSEEKFPELNNLTQNDYVIVCGNFGLIWNDTITERWWIKWLSEKNYNILFVGGCHENYDRLYGDEFTTVDYCGGRARKICDNIYHLLRGYIFDFNGKSFFSFGGGKSPDISLRTEHITWWQEEMPSHEEMALGIQNLTDHNNSVDYLITHCLPYPISSVVTTRSHKSNELTDYFDNLSNMLSFSNWFCGCYLEDKTVVEDLDGNIIPLKTSSWWERKCSEEIQFQKKYTALYDKMIRVL